MRRKAAAARGLSRPRAGGSSAAPAGGGPAAGEPQAPGPEAAPPEPPRLADPQPGRLRAAVRRTLPEPGPQRLLAGASFAVTVGGGMLAGTTMLYLTRIVGMSAVRVGLGLTVGAVLGLVFGPYIGHLADRRGPREVHVATMLCGVAATAGFAVARTFWVLVLVSLLTTAVGSAGQASRAPLIRALAGADTTAYLAYQRAITNVAIMAGVLIGTVGIQLDSGPVYVGLILAAAGTFLAAALILTRLPHVPPLPADPAHSRWAALTDRPYLAVTLINGGMSLHLAVPTFALPLWIVENTSAPRAAITGIMLVNGVLVVALQVRVSRGVTDPRTAGLRMRWAGGALLAASVLIGAMSGLAWWSALLVLLAATVVYTFGELWQAAASFELAFGLARPHLQGQYAGVFGLGAGGANAAAPAVLAAVCLDHGQAGWWALGVLLLGCGALTPRAVAWAEATRGRAAAPV
ncbi:MFS transporter [Actinacidiphila bryophytorum]|uniref:MFS transporter n=1 Tax=Actinacidiphila bryophytorum TaxID=1436133 RepID=UPI002176B2F5|nr:MFS transporter [Actinacidiphila bryophytorum]UWE12217.1 MFS transporter [Actinacidiphila bryophytorum]